MGTVVTGAVVTGAVVTGAVVTGAVVTGAVVTGAVVIGTVVIGTVVIGVKDVTVADVLGVRLSTCTSPVVREDVGGNRFSAIADAVQAQSRRQSRSELRHRQVRWLRCFNIVFITLSIAFDLGIR